MSDSRRVPLLWCEIRLGSRVPIPQQEHSAFRAESFVLTQCLKLAASRFLSLLATSTQFFPTCIIRRVSRCKGGQDRCRVRSAWFEKLPSPNTTAISNPGGCVRQRKCCELEACRMQRCESSDEACAEDRHKTAGCYQHSSSLL